MPGKKKTPITENDALLTVLAMEDLSVDEWMEREGVPKEVIKTIAHTNMEVFLTRTAEGAEVMGALFGALSTVFMYGWECGRELGRRKETTD